MVILLNGPINSGKTTVAKELVKKLDKCAHIEVDWLREFIRSVALEEAIPINRENTIVVAKNLLNHEFNVIISYPMGQFTVNEIVKTLAQFDQKIFLFTLSPRLDIAMTNRGTRELTENEQERIKYHYDTGVANPGIGLVIDNSNQTVAQTVEQILVEITSAQSSALII